MVEVTALGVASVKAPGEANPKKATYTGGSYLERFDPHQDECLTGVG